MNKENLLKLAAYLLSNDLKANFDMRLYSTENTPTCDQTECGTVGCAVGHGPYAGIQKLKGENWHAYSDRVFGKESENPGFRWTWCFSDQWYLVDNTPQGAAKRILHMLRKGVPENWSSQLAGHDKLSYTNETL